MNRFSLLNAEAARWEAMRAAGEKSAREYYNAMRIIGIARGKLVAKIKAARAAKPLQIVTPSATRQQLKASLGYWKRAR